MKLVRLVAVAALVSAFATASFAGSCCSKKKECPQDKAPKQEQKAPQAPAENAPSQPSAPAQPQK